MSEFILSYYQYIVIAHVFFMAIGVGGATVTDVLFLKFLRNNNMSRQELIVMDTLSQVIWAALVGILVTGLVIFLPQASDLLENSKFLAKMSVVGVLIVNGVLLNVKIAPKMHLIFSVNKDLNPVWLQRTRRLAFALGAISIVSWYSAFLLGSLRSIELSYFQLISIYISLLVFGLVGSQISERLFAKQLR